MIAIDEIPQHVDAILAEYLASRRAEICDIDPATALAFEILCDFMKGGKRVRPMFAWAGFVSAESDEDPHAVLRAISALEFIQACALIHDDIIDSSDTRRGKPTVHRAVEKHHRDQGWNGDSAHYGKAVATLIGDLALTWSDDMLNSAGLSDAALHRALVPWRAMRTEVIAGQILDITVEASGDERVEEAEKINLYKTAAYTIARPLHLGAAIANTSADAFLAYGRSVGVAYQLRDDVLGVFGDPAVTGKPAGDDLREGKRTVLLATTLQLLDATNPSEAAILRERIGTPNIEGLPDIIQRSGALERIEEMIQALVDTGIAHLDESLPSDALETLKSLALTATSRHA
ncbi:MAG: polyprenyl synthetase family protein [Corynebacterium sp.]|nr:polyprenyl synthetase family protein [Corynebacterium sp.]